MANLVPETTEQRADFAIQRLPSAVERHNSKLCCNVDLAFGCGPAQHAPGPRITDTLQTAERKAFLHRHDLVPVF